jgi:hypothetical protein
MKRTWKYLLMAALVLGLGMNVTSCKDDDDDNNNERTPEEIAQDPYEKESEAADALYRLVSQLSVCDSLPNNWKTATFEPKAGKVLDASQPRVRTIAVNNAAEAVARYNSLTGKDLPATTITDTYKVEGVGTLQLNVGGAGTIATIDVDVKQMPQLAQLRLVSVADMGENGHFKGEPYYRFGDVVMDKDGCYWICVRPAYSPNGKEDTHWMSFQVTEKNIKTYTKKGCEQQVYPVDLGVQKEKMQYLAQLLAILANPADFQNEADLQGYNFNDTGLGGLQPAAMPVESLILQAKLWQQYNVWEKIMPVGFDKTTRGADLFKHYFKLSPLHFVYEKGSVSGKNLTIKYVEYTDADHFYKNEPEYKKEVINIQDDAFDITNSYTTKGVNSSSKKIVPDAFVVRYKSGYQLSSNLLFSPSATDSIPGVTTVHRFNDRKDKVIYSKLEAQPGMIMAKDGNFYKSEAACEAFNTKPVALVVYVGFGADVSSLYRGLAVSYKTVDDLAAWDDSNNREKVCIENTSNNARDWENERNGINRTKKLCEDGHNHPAAKAAWEFSVDGFNPTKYGYSRWFLPTVGQMLMACEGLGIEYALSDDSQSWVCNFPETMNTDLQAAGANTFEIDSFYWTSTEINPKSAVFFNIGPTYGAHGGTDTQLKTEMAMVRPFIAF